MPTKTHLGTVRSFVPGIKVAFVAAGFGVIGSNGAMGWLIFVWRRDPFAPDALTTVGGYPNDDYNGGQLFNRIDKPKLTQDFIACAQWLKTHALSNGKVCVTGFCFGGGVSNTLATMLGPDLAAAAPFYGGAPPVAEVAKVKAAILVHHGGLDTALVNAWPAYEAELKKNNVPNEGHIWPNSVHGFFNDATPERYNKVTAPQAWSRTIEWFNQYSRTA